MGRKEAHLWGEVEVQGQRYCCYDPRAVSPPTYPVHFSKVSPQFPLAIPLLDRSPCPVRRPGAPSTSFYD